MRVLNRYLGGTGVSTIVELLETYGIASNAWTQGNDFATLISARSNDYSTYSTLVSAYQANDWVTWNAAISNDATTLLSARSNDYTTYTAALSNDYTTLTSARSNDYLTYIAATVNVRSEFANTALSIKFVGQPAGFWSPSSNVMYANVSGQDVTYWANAASGNVFGIMGQMNVAGNIHIFQANASVMFARHDAGPNPGLVANGASVMLTDAHFVPRDNVAQNLGRHAGAWWGTVFAQNIRTSNAIIFADNTVMTTAPSASSGNRVFGMLF